MATSAIPLKGQTPLPGFEPLPRSPVGGGFHGCQTDPDSGARTPGKLNAQRRVPSWTTREN